MIEHAGPRRARWLALPALGLLFFLVFNANGREIPSADSQGARLASIMLARRHALTLDGVVGRQPLYGERAAFQQDREGHWRNACPLPPVLEAAAVAAILRSAGVIDLEAPLAPATVAKVTASLFASLAAVLAFLVARRFCGPVAATAVAIGFGLGTGVWPVASQTLWQHASAIWSAIAALWLWTRRDGARGPIQFTLIGLLLGWSASARPQTLPMIAVLAAGVLLRASPRERAACTLALLLPLAVFAGFNLRWFGHVLGAAPQIERTTLSIHAVRHTWTWPWPGLPGLLVSPSRGLLVFSPIVLVVLAARSTAGSRHVLRWTAAAAAAQFVAYGSYAIWWGGFTYGPRYALDVLPALLPAAALGASRIAAGGLVLRAAAAIALVWSIAVQATGAFCYPHDAWNTDPVSVDVAHERLWEVHDSQIARCWQSGLSPQNFALFTRAAWRRTE